MNDPGGMGRRQAPQDLPRAVEDPLQWLGATRRNDLPQGSAPQAFHDQGRGRTLREEIMNLDDVGLTQPG